MHHTLKGVDIVDRAHLERRAGHNKDVMSDGMDVTGKKDERKACRNAVHKE